MSQVFLPCVAGPLASAGGAAQPIFFAPLTSTLVPTTAGNPAFTFTRATTAYVADQDGILRNAVAGEARFQGARRVRNLETFTANMDNAVWGVFGGATKGAGTVIFPADPNANVAQVTNVLSTGTASKLIAVSMTVSVAAGTGQFRIQNTHSAAVAYLSPDLIATTTPQRFAFTQQYTSAAGNGAVNAGIQNGSGGAAATFIVSNIQVEDVTGQSNQAPGEYVSVGVLAAPYHGNAIDGVRYSALTNGNSVAGNVVTEATGTAIPLATTLGYVAENAATNLCLQSQTFDNAAWTINNASGVPNAIAAPDGTVTADSFTDSVANAFHRIYQSVAVTASQLYTFSVYLKSGTLPWAQLECVATADVWANFNLQTGVVGNKSAGAVASIVALPNGWYRCSISITAGAASMFAMLYTINADINAAQPSYVGTGQTMYLWGAQVETGSDPTSYVPTTTVAVTRAFDNLSYQMVSNVSGSVGTSYSEAYSPTPWPTPALTAQQDLLIRQTGSFYFQYYDPAKTLGMFAGTAVTTANARGVGVVNKNASAWSGATRSICLNGGAVATGAFTTQTDVDLINIGVDPSATNHALKGSIRNVKFYNVRIADADLITMTA